MLRNPDHVTVAVADAERAVEFFALLGFRKTHVAYIDGGEPARHMGMPDMKAQHITLTLEGSDPHFEIQLLAFDPKPTDDPGEHPTNKRRRGYNHLAFRVDALSAVMILIVTGVGFLLHLYSIGYMEDDPDLARYFAYLNLFTGSMLILVLADSLPVLFIGWEGVGLCSYLLIGFWYREMPNADAGEKAMLANRIGDAAFLIGMFLLFWSLASSGEATLVIHDVNRQAGTLAAAMPPSKNSTSSTRNAR